MATYHKVIVITRNDDQYESSKTVIVKNAPNHRFAASFAMMFEANERKSLDWSEKYLLDNSQAIGYKRSTPIPEGYAEIISMVMPEVVCLFDLQELLESGNYKEEEYDSDKTTTDKLDVLGTSLPGELPAFTSEEAKQVDDGLATFIIKKVDDSNGDSGMGLFVNGRLAYTHHDDLYTPVLERSIESINAF